MSSRRLIKLPIEYSRDGLVLNDDIYSHIGKVLLIPKGETVTREKLERLMGFYKVGRDVMVYEDTYLEIMSDANITPEVRQQVTESHVGYSKLQQDIGGLFQQQDYGR